MIWGESADDEGELESGMGVTTITAEAMRIGALRKSYDLCDGDILKGIENNLC